jgi:hypothetical protein
VARYSVIWCDGDSAGIVCICGAEAGADVDGRVCSDCGRRYTLTSFITVAEPVGHCARNGCDAWVYRTRDGRSAKRIYCGPECYELAQRQKARAR